MNLASLFSVRDNLDRAYEFFWRRTSPHTIPRGELLRPVPDEELARIEITWPSTYVWEPRRILGDQVRDALRRFVTVREAEVPQPWDHVVTCEIAIRDRGRWTINVETSDYWELNEAAARAVPLHFKMEYLLGGYPGFDNVIPVSYTNADARIYNYLPRLRAMRDRLPPLFQVYGRYGLSLEKRRKPMAILGSATRFAFYGGTGKVRYSRYLREAARARVCIDLPSMSSMTFRLIDLLAIGSCIVGPPHTNQLLAPFVNGEHVLYCRPDYEDLEDVVARVLGDPALQRKLVTGSRAFFDRYAHRDQAASWLLSHCLERLQ